MAGQAADEIPATVIFDLDGTLVDTARDLIAAANASLAEAGALVALDPEADAAIAFRGGRAMLRAGFGRLGRAWDEAEVDAAYPRLLALYDAAIAVHSRPYPGAAAAVGALRAAGYRTGICTNKPEALSEKLLRALDLFGLFDSHVGADTLPVRKPDPLPLVEAIGRAGGSVGRALLVGDTATDRQTGFAAGVKVALVTFGPEGRAVADLRPEALLDGYDGLGALVGRLLGPARAAAD